jgi:hypothetical protein
MKKIAMGLLACVLASAAAAQVTVSSPWVRATVPVQKSSGAFMVLRAARDSRLVEVSSPVAERVELHKSSMDDGMMKMEQVDAIELPAGKDVPLASGGYHLMLFGLKRQLKEGETVPLTLVVAADKKREQVKISAKVQPLTYNAGHAGH